MKRCARLPKRVAVAIFALLLLIITVESKAKTKDFLQSPVLVNKHPGESPGSEIVFGVNRLRLIAEWEDDFFTDETEAVGEVAVEVDNYFIGLQSIEGPESVFEFDLLGGQITLKEKTTRYFSNVIGREVDVKQNGDGYDFGLRMASSTTLGRSNFIYWNTAWSLYIAFFSIDSTVAALSVDGQRGNTYNEEVTGLFLRPALMFQPILRLSRYLSLIPYTGIGTRVILSSWSAEDTEIILGGTTQPGLLGEASGTEAQVSGLDLLLGFDMRISGGERHNVTLGAATDRLFETTDADYKEVHLYYNYNFK